MQSGRTSTDSRISVGSQASVDGKGSTDSRPRRAVSAPTESLAMEAAAAEVEAEQLQEQQEQHLQGNETPGHQSTGCLSPIPESSRDFQAYPKSSPARMAKRAETVPSHQFMQAMIDSSPRGRSPFMGVDEAAAATSPPLVMPPPNYAQSAGGSSLSADGRSNCRSASLRRSTGKGIQDLQEGVPVAEQLGLSVRGPPHPSPPIVINTSN